MEERGKKWGLWRRNVGGKAKEKKGGEKSLVKERGKKWRDVGIME